LRKKKDRAGKSWRRKSLRATNLIVPFPKEFCLAVLSCAATFCISAAEKSDAWAALSGSQE
jgi:hypothetical protein